MESLVNQSSPPPTIQFPVSSAGQDDSQERQVVDTMDFFADENNNEMTCLRLLTANTSSDQSIVEDRLPPADCEENNRNMNEIEVVKAELERMGAENRVLKEMLNQVSDNYQSLQTQMMSLMQPQKEDHHGKEDNTIGGQMLPRQFMDLGLATGGGPKETVAEETNLSEGRSCGRERTSRSSASAEDSPEKGSSCWGTNKVPRLGHGGGEGGSSVDQAATEATMRKARVSVRARSEAPMITDGCQWRKYGQKMAKGNPCPRAYYRCTMASGCPVRKQVQRCADDRSILITTYEGNHNHPLPPAAMAMASTTSSAAKMLLSGSLPSADGLMNPNMLARTLFPCSSSMATISASAPFPTVTLDLTQTTTTAAANNNPLHHFPAIRNQNQQFQLPSAAAILPQIFGHALYTQTKFSGLQFSQDVDAASQANTQLVDTLNSLASDPNFTAVIVAAITSLIGNSSNPAANDTSNGNNKSANSSVPAN